MEDAVHAVPETGMQKASARRKSVDDGSAKYVFHGSGPPGRMPRRQYRKGFRTRMALSPIEASAIDGGIDRGTACRRPDRKGSEGLTTWRCLRGSTGGWHRMPVRAPVTEPLMRNLRIAPEGKHWMPSACRKAGPRIGESGVGSDAGPICIGHRSPCADPVILGLAYCARITHQMLPAHRVGSSYTTNCGANGAIGWRVNDSIRRLDYRR